MKNYFIAMCAVSMLVMGVASASAHPGCEPFMRGLTSPSDLADKIEFALRRDPSGTRKIDQKRCDRDGSCASPADWLVKLNESDTSAQMNTVQELPPYLRKLVQVSAPEGIYKNAGLRVMGHNEFSPDWNCAQSEFKQGEKVWMNPKSKRIVIKENCANPVMFLRPIPPAQKKLPPRVEVPPPRSAPCAEVHFFARTPDTNAEYALTGPRQIVSDCFGIKRVGETNFHPWADECANGATCNFTNVTQFIGQPVQRKGSVILQPGEYVLRVPAEAAQLHSLFRVVLCDHRGEVYSDGRGVQWFDYRLNPAGIPTAIVYYSREEIPADAPQLSWTWGEWQGRAL